ncbi:60s acidic ribosomal protein P2, variant 2 [Taiwanofungus camphoratus]|nr:60s acidic ribosomal protein P2, variant 2 [Antrodia cinnamomea]KAI0956086.1 60s acidic ribosomal protein P2, variant 2 [Antrodia cinnamomea]
MGATRAQKELYFAKLKDLIAKYPSIFVVNVDNVGSNQMHQIRVALRGKGIVVMGKNTMVRRALRSILSEYPQFERLLPHVKGNIGFVFTSGDLKDIRDIITANKVAAPARAGALAPKNVSIPAGNTGMEPGKTSFFQALGIPTKIARGTIEIVSDVQVVTAGTRVGPSEATLLNMLNISPFTYGMTVVQIFDQGNVFSPDVLDVSDKELLDRFLSGVQTIAAISLALHYPTLVSVLHSLVNSYKNLIAVSLATDYTFEGSQKVSDCCSVYKYGPRMFIYPSHTENAERPKDVCCSHVDFCSLMDHTFSIYSLCELYHLPFLPLLDRLRRSSTTLRPLLPPLPLPLLPRLLLPHLQRRSPLRRKKKRRSLMVTWYALDPTQLY